MEKGKPLSLCGVTGQCEIDDEQRFRLARENIARCQAFKANPPPAPPQADYVVTPLTSPLPVMSRRDKRRIKQRGRQQRAAENHKAPMLQPVRLTAIAPPPPSSLLDYASELDGAQ